MESQFDRAVPARVGVEAEKWDLMKPGLGPDIVPLSVADMEFASPHHRRLGGHRPLRPVGLHRLGGPLL